MIIAVVGRNFGAKLLNSNLQLPLKSTSLRRCAFPRNHKTPVIHKEHLKFSRWIMSIFQDREGMSSRSLLITMVFIHLSFSGTYSCLALASIQTGQPVVQKQDEISSIQRKWHIYITFKVTHLTCPAWLSCWAPMMSSWMGNSTMIASYVCSNLYLCFRPRVSILLSPMPIVDIGGIWSFFNNPP